jgi:hypothetical protein
MQKNGDQKDGESRRETAGDRATEAGLSHEQTKHGGYPPSVGEYYADVENSRVYLRP